MEEERRNCFVAITRTKERLVLSRGKKDGRTNHSVPTPSGSRANRKEPNYFSFADHPLWMPSVRPSIFLFQTTVRFWTASAYIGQ